jgi:ferritin-like protein
MVKDEKKTGKWYLQETTSPNFKTLKRYDIRTLGEEYSRRFGCRARENIGRHQQTVRQRLPFLKGTPVQ